MHTHVGIQGVAVVNACCVCLCAWLRVTASNCSLRVPDSGGFRLRISVGAFTFASQFVTTCQWGFINFLCVLCVCLIGRSAHMRWPQSRGRPLGHQKKKDVFRPGAKSWIRCGFFNEVDFLGQFLGWSPASSWDGRPPFLGLIAGQLLEPPPDDLSGIKDACKTRLNICILYSPLPSRTRA